MGLITPNDYNEFKPLYVDQLRYLLSTENQIVDGLQSMIEHAQDQQLIQAFKMHQEQTRTQAQRLEQILNELQDGGADDKKDPIITAIIGSGVNIVRESKEGPIRDAGLIATAQKVEHYEIASYGSARDWARILGYDSHARLLEQTLEEEKQTDQILTNLSRQENRAAATASTAS